jgi:glyoxylase-like metal-dependent hydrolase (beta-lactamase superfamily II)
MWTRRQLLATLPAVAVAGPITRAAGAADTGEGQLRALREGVGTFTDRGGTIGWLITPDAHVVVDSQFPDTARVLLNGLRQRTKRPIDALVNTHHHADHTAGNSVLGPTAKQIVAHENVPRLQREAAVARETVDEQTYPTVTFPDTWSLDLGNTSVWARHFGPAHTSGDIVIVFPSANVVHMGDLVFNRWFPFIDRPAGASIAGWIDTLEKVHAGFDDDTLFIFGHARPEYPTVGGRKDLLVQRDLLAALLERVTEARQAGQSREEAVSLNKLPGFPNHTSPGANLSLRANLEVAWEETT